MSQLVFIIVSLSPARLYFSCTTIISIVVGYVDIINPDVAISEMEHMPRVFRFSGCDPLLMELFNVKLAVCCNLAKIVHELMIYLFDFLVDW